MSAPVSPTLARYEQPPCEACASMAREAVVPHGEGALGCCWLCAHAIADHGVEPGQVMAWYEAGPCGCARRAIWPKAIADKMIEVAPSPAIEGQLMTVVSPEYGLDGARTGRTMRVDYERVGGTERHQLLKVVGVHPPDGHGPRVAEGMRAARVARLIKAGGS